jgi:hypothetical protein
MQVHRQCGFELGRTHPRVAGHAYTGIAGCMHASATIPGCESLDLRYPAGPVGLPAGVRHIFFCTGGPLTRAWCAALLHAAAFPCVLHAKGTCAGANTTDLSRQRRISRHVLGWFQSKPAEEREVKPAKGGRWSTCCWFSVLTRHMHPNCKHPHHWVGSRH